MKREILCGGEIGSSGNCISFYNDYQRKGKKEKKVANFFKDSFQKNEWCYAARIDRECVTKVIVWGMNLSVVGVDSGRTQSPIWIFLQFKFAVDGKSDIPVTVINPIGITLKQVAPVQFYNMWAIFQYTSGRGTQKC